MRYNFWVGQMRLSRKLEGTRPLRPPRFLRPWRKAVWVYPGYNIVVTVDKTKGVEIYPYFILLFSCDDYRPLLVLLF